MTSEKQKLLNLINSGDEGNIILAFEIAKSQEIYLQEELNGYRRILSRDLKEEEKSIISAHDLIFLYKEEDVTLFSNREQEGIPNELRYLKHLKNLYLVGTPNYILPEYIFHFRYLEYLTISNFNLQKIPSIISNLVNLKQLRICGCNIKSFSSELSGLENLDSLDLSFNNLDNLPENIGDLKKIKFLNLCCNPINKLPETFYKLDLDYLFLIDTSLTVEQIHELITHFRHVCFTDWFFREFYVLFLYYFYRYFRAKK